MAAGGAAALMMGNSAGYKQPIFVGSDGSSAGGNMPAITGSLAGDFLLLMSSNGNGNLTIPSAAPSGHTWIGSGILSDEASSETGMRVSGKFQLANNEAIPDSGGTNRATALLFRGVDPTIFSHLTFVYGAASGANIVIPPLSGFIRPATWVYILKQMGADAALSSTRIHIQNSGSAPVQAFWSGASGTPGTQGTDVPSFAGESVAAFSGNARAAFVMALYGAPK